MKVNFKTWKMMLAFAAITAFQVGCSSSQVDENADGAPVETADASGTTAPTDEVPTAEDAPVAEDPNLAEQAPMPPPSETSEVIAEAPVSEAPVTEAPSGEAPLTEAPVAEAPVAEAPQNMDAAPVAETQVDSSGPAIEPAPVVESTSMASGGGGETSYQVKRGDTLMKIAFENYGDIYRWREILEANRGKINDPNHIPPGTQLALNGAGMVQIERNGEQYLIKRGETLGVISNNVYGTPRKWKRLWENNRQLIKDPNKIYAGFYLYYVPEGRLTGSGAPEQGASVTEPAVQDMPQTDPQQVESPDARVPASN